MSSPDAETKLARDIRRRDWIYAAHVCLCAAMVGWRVLETTPATASAQGGGFTQHPFGIALAMISLWLCAASALSAVALTIASWRDPKVCLLAVFMALSMSRRQSIDVFDVTYVALVAILAVWWFHEERPRLASALSRGPRACAR
jgi:hypothetical protein